MERESYTVHDINELLAAQNEYALARLEWKGTEEQARTRLLTPDGPFCTRKNLSVQSHATTQVQASLRAERAELDALRSKLEAAREALTRRRARLESARRLLSGPVREETEKKRAAIAQHEAESAALARKLRRRRKQLLASLEEIYPIDVVEPSILLFSIAGVPLPNMADGAIAASSQQPRPKGAANEAARKLEEQLCNDDDTVSSALGLAAQLLVLLSAYLGIPLHYTIAPAGSRSVIHDAISAIAGPRVFPLYARGMERYRFEYALFLLQKNAEQLCSQLSVAVLDIRHVLPNIKNAVASFLSSSDDADEVARSRARARTKSSAPSGDGGDDAERRSEITLRDLSPSATVVSGRSPSTKLSAMSTSIESSSAGSGGFAGQKGKTSLRHFAPSPLGAANPGKSTVANGDARAHGHADPQALLLGDATDAHAHPPPKASPTQEAQTQPSSFAWLTWRGTQAAASAAATAASTTASSAVATMRRTYSGPGSGSGSGSAPGEADAQAIDIDSVEPAALAALVEGRQPPVIRSLGSK